MPRPEAAPGPPRAAQFALTLAPRGVRPFDDPAWLCELKRRTRSRPPAGLS